MYNSLSPFSGGGYDSFSSGSYGGGYGNYGFGRPDPVADPANPNAANPEQPNLRNEYQGMVSGLGSILQLGYASVSMVVFTRNLASIIKTSYAFLKDLLTRFGRWVFKLPIIRLIPKLLDKLRTESASVVAGNSSLVSRLLLLFRVVIAGCLFALFYIKRELKEDNMKDIDQLTVQLQAEENTLQQNSDEIPYQKEGFF